MLCAALLGTSPNPVIRPLIVLPLCACSAVRAVLSEASCSDLVPGSFTETVAEAPPGGSAAVAYYQDAGPIYVVAAADVRGAGVPGSGLGAARGQHWQPAIAAGHALLTVFIIKHLPHAGWRQQFCRRDTERWQQHCASRGGGHRRLRHHPRRRHVRSRWPCLAGRRAALPGPGPALQGADGSVPQRLPTRPSAAGGWCR